ncbi:MAG: DUF2723 domain-containing protein [Chloroflexi bacterium]|nr:DUF2723 domain-containing protein [Chloroflexota bacterium]
MTLIPKVTSVTPTRATRVWAFATRPVLLCAFAVLAALLLYWRTAYPSVLPGDSGELQFAAWGFWLAHPTGYPLYLILGGIWQHLLPFGDPAYRLNLFSALWSGLAVGVAFLVFWNVTRARGASVIAALTFAVSPHVWSQATRAEVYALNTFLVALLALLGLLWNAKPRRRYAFAFAFVFGLSLAHHRMTLLLAPAFAALLANRLFALRRNPAQFIKRALLYSAVAAVPLVLYLYIPLRAGATPYATLDVSLAAPIVVFENSPRGWLAVILGSGFSEQLGIDAVTLAALREFPNLLLTQFNPVGVAAALFGFGALLWQRKFEVAAFAFFGWLAFVAFNSVYHIGDIADYYTPAYFFACLALAEGIAFSVRQLRQHPCTRGSTLHAITLLAFFALLPMQNLFREFESQNHRRRADTRVQWETLLASGLPQNALVISNDRDELTPLYYLQYVEDKRPDLVGLFPKIAAGPNYANVVALVERVAPSNRPLYALKPIPALVMKFIIGESKNGLWKIHVLPLPAPKNSSDAMLGDALRVRGWAILEGDARAGEKFTLGVQYEPRKHLTRDYMFSVQLFDGAGKKIAQGNDHVPGVGEYPPSQWRVGDVIQDQYALEPSPDTAAGEYKIMLRAYDSSDDAALGELTEIGVLQIGE